MGKENYSKRHADISGGWSSQRPFCVFCYIWLTWWNVQLNLISHNPQFTIQTKTIFASGISTCIGFDCCWIVFKLMGNHTTRGIACPSWSIRAISFSLSSLRGSVALGGFSLNLSKSISCMLPLCFCNNNRLSTCCTTCSQPMEKNSYLVHTLILV